MKRTREKVIDIIIMTLTSIILLDNVLRNYYIFHKGRTIFSVTEENQTFTPPVLMCPNIPLNPVRLLDFGLNLNLTSTATAMRDMRSLNGVAENTSLWKIMDQAWWPLGNLIQEVEIGRLKEKYNISTKTSPLWKQSDMNPLCYELKTLPVLDTDTLIIRQRETSDIILHYQASVHGVDESGVLPVLHFIRRLFVYKLLLSSAKGYILKNWASPIYNVWQEQENVQFYSVNLVEYHGHDRMENCRLNCYHQYAEQTDVCLSRYPGPKDLLKKPCNLKFLPAAKDDCLKKCGNPVSVNKWRIMKQPQFVDQNILIITMNRKKKVISEKYVYTSYKFYSDIGGSLGLFLGVSFFTGLECVMNLAVKFGLHKHICLTLVSYSVKLLLVLVTVVHILLSVQEISQQHPLTFVTLESSSSNQDSHALLNFDSNVSSGMRREDHIFYYMNNSSFQEEYLTEVLVRNALSKRLAMRSVGCHILSFADPLVQCILSTQKATISGIEPFKNVSDLPVCPSTIYSLPVMKYLVPSDISDIKFDKSVIRSCLGYHGTTADRLLDGISNSRLKIGEGYGYTFLDIFVEIGGIIGLYLGISISSILGEILRGEMATFGIKGCHVKHFYKFIILVLVLLTLSISIFQIYVFLFAHPISITTDVYPLDGYIPVTATACLWPPINTRQLLKSVKLKFPELSIDSLALNGELEKLALDLSMNGTYFREVWHYSQWDINPSNISRHLSGSHSTVFPFGHKCFAFNTTGRSIKLFYFPEDTERSFQFYVTIHARNDTPLLDMHYNTSEKFSGTVVKMADYIPLDAKSNEKYGTCIDNCLQQWLSDKLQCNIPFLTNSYPGVNCNYSVIAELLRWYFQPEPRYDDLYPYMSHIKTIQETCQNRCAKCSKTFLQFVDDLGEESRIASGFTVFSKRSVVVRIDRKMTTKDVTEEYDGLTSSQLISKIGGATGVLLGVSVLSALRMSFHYFLRRGRSSLTLQ